MVGRDNTGMSPLCSYNVLMVEGGTICCDGKPSCSCSTGAIPARTCHAWVPAEHVCGKADDCDRCDTGNCGVETCPDYVARIYRKGYCSRIEASKKIAGSGL